MNRHFLLVVLATVLGAIGYLPLNESQAAGACATGCTGKSALRCAAEGLNEGEWCAFDTTDNSKASAQKRMRHDALETCSSCCPRWTWTYTDSLAWWRGPAANDNGRILFDGSPHNGSSLVMRYEESSNTWSSGTGSFRCGGQSCSNGNLSSPGAYTTGCSTARHGYDENAVDPATGRLYRLLPKSGGSRFLVYNPDSDNWQSLSSSPLGDEWANFGVATKFFPEWNVGGASGAFIVVARHQLLQTFNPDTNQWSQNLGGVSFDSGLHYAMEYNPRHQVMWLMDGEGGRGAGTKHYRLEANGRITALRPLNGVGKPRGFGVTSLIVASDSGTGRFIVWDCDGGGNWFAYDIMRDLWGPINHSMPPLNDENGCSTGNVAEVSFTNYGVNGFLVTESREHTLYLYRNAETDLIPPDSPSGVEAD